MSLRRTMMAGSGGGGVIVPLDPHLGKVVAHLHFDGADNSTTFIDRTRRVWTAQNSARIETDKVKFGTAAGWFRETPGWGSENGSRIWTPDHESLRFGTGDWTVEGWFIPSAPSIGFGGFYRKGQNTSDGLQLAVTPTQLILRSEIYTDSVVAVSLSTTEYSHIAFVRDGNTIRFFVNGSQVGTDTRTFNHTSTEDAYIGSSTGNTSYSYNGMIDELRITKGVARYTEDFDVPTAPFPDRGNYLDGRDEEPRATYSLRKRISYAAKALRVRRSSDDAEQDIGFVDDRLDVAALLAFVGGGSGYVRTLYDQTGNGHDAYQTNLLAQPAVVVSGSYLGLMRFDGADDALTIASLTQGTPYCGAYFRVKQANSASYRSLFETGTTWLTPGGGIVLTTMNDSATLAMGSTNAPGSGDEARLTKFDMVSMTAIETLSALYNRTLTGLGELALYRAGVALTPAVGGPSIEQTGNYASLTTHLGGRSGSHADMDLETAIFYNADTAAMRAEIEDLLAYAPLTPWDAHYLSGVAALGEDDRLLGATGTTPYANSRSLVPLSGLVYFSAECVKNGSNNWGFGVADEAVVLSSGGNYVGAGNSVGLWYEGRVYQGGASTHTASGINGVVEGAVNVYTRAVWLRNGEASGYIGGGDPEAGTSPTGVLGGTGALYLAGSIDPSGMATGFIRLPDTAQDVSGTAPGSFKVGVY